MEPFTFEEFGSSPAPSATGAADSVLTLVADARAEADAIRQAAYAEGHEAGRQEALLTATGAAEALADAVGAARRATAERAEQLELGAVELALALADKIVGATLAVQPELVVDAVRTALRGIVEREHVTVLVSPADLELVSEAIGAVQRELGGIEHIEVQAERRVGPGGAVVRHAAGEVDARTEVKLERAREVVETALRDAAA